ncbi:hypothetical protein WG66_012143 [Moniliophthora roreri]|nr:hypothetical protein WG66_012143 [Moniliophthora roreri]
MPGSWLGRGGSEDGCRPNCRPTAGTQVESDTAQIPYIWRTTRKPPRRPKNTPTFRLACSMSESSSSESSGTIFTLDSPLGK